MSKDVDLSGSKQGGSPTIIAAPAAPASERAPSIYDLYSPLRRGIILGVVSLASIMCPLSDTIYLPALAAVAQSLNTSMALVALSVSIYMFLVGFSGLVWGPASDRFGRRIIFLAASALFVATSIGCALAPSIWVLVVFRALQGTAVGAYIVAGQGAIADVFPPAQRGTASGIYMIPLLVGPIVGPLLGGGLSQAFGWRATFYACVACALLVALIITLLLPETHQWMALTRMAKHDPDAAAAIAEAPQITRPRFHSPLLPLAMWLDPAVAPHLLNGTVSFATMFATLTELPAALAQPPFSFSEGIIGLCYLPVGVGGLVASPAGGALADMLARRFATPAARLSAADAVTVSILPAALLGFGWSLHNVTNTTAALAGALTSQFLVGAATAAYWPGLFSWLTVTKQDAAAAAASASEFGLTVAAGVVVQVASLAVAALGFGPLFSIFAALQVVVSAVAGAMVWREMQAARCTQGRCGGGGAGLGAA